MAIMINFLIYVTLSIYIFFYSVNTQLLLIVVILKFLLNKSVLDTDFFFLYYCSKLCFLVINFGKLLVEYSIINSRIVSIINCLPGYFIRIKKYQALK